MFFIRFIEKQSMAYPSTRGESIDLRQLNIGESIVKQKLIAGFFAICLVVGGLFAPQSVAAYSGVEGCIYWGEDDINPWEHGVQIRFVYQNPFGFSPNQPLTRDANGCFSAPFPDLGGLPADGSQVLVFLTFDYGGNGTPQQQQFQFTQQTATPGNFDLGPIYTNTGPTAVTLQNFGLQSGGAFLPLLVLGLALMTGATIFVARRRQSNG
jgi:hypothetical protein